MVAQWVWHRNWCNCKPNQQDSLEYSFLVKWAPWYNSLQNSTSTSSGEQWAYAAEDEGQGLKILLCLVTASWKPAESRCEVAAQPLPFRAWKCSSISKLAATGLLSQCLVVTAWTQANITFCWTQGRTCFKQTQLLVHSSDAQGSCPKAFLCYGTGAERHWQSSAEAELSNFHKGSWESEFPPGKQDLSLSPALQSL